MHGNCIARLASNFPSPLAGEGDPKGRMRGPLRAKTFSSSTRGESPLIPGFAGPSPARGEGKSPDHINLAHRLVHLAGAFPVFRKKRHCIRRDLNYLAGLMRVSAPPEQEVAEFIAGDMAIPISRRANPDTAFALAIRTFEYDNAAGARFTFDHGRDYAPILERPWIGRGIFQMGCGGSEVNIYLNM